MDLWVAGDRGCSAKSCGSGLAHEGGRSGILSVADTPPSRASSLPHWFCGLPGIAGVARNPVGVGLLTKAAGRAIYLWLTHRLREQARSHIGFVGCRGSRV
ncbi:hypothetical protein EVS84_27280 [Pseudomonas koreensis]|uniref:DUF1534 domain-containing protein n=1 Tax=Pseudomonas koreensis TaxID=198620 RepID=A0A4V1WGG5_9PSED|nr:hypothetical protein EVS84_27280 [Pseudomonas koreensis]